MLTRALDRMLDRSSRVPVETPLIYGVIPRLEFAATMILRRGGEPVVDPISPGEIDVYLLAASLAKTPPVELDAYQRKWITHPIPYVQRRVIESLTNTRPPWAMAPLLERVASTDLAVQYAAIIAAGQSKDRSFGPAFLEALGTTDDRWIAEAASNAATTVGVPRDQILLAWTDRLDRPFGKDPNNRHLALIQLIDLIDHNGSSTGGTLDDLVKVKPLWIAFIRQNADAIRAGRVFKITDPEVSPDMFPQTCTVRVDGKDWPVRDEAAKSRK